MKKSALAAIVCHFPSVCLMRMTPRMTKGCRKYGKQKERRKTLACAFKLILGLGKRRGFDSDFGDNAEFAPDAC